MAETIIVNSKLYRHYSFQIDFSSIAYNLYLKYKIPLGTTDITNSLIFNYYKNEPEYEFYYELACHNTSSYWNVEFATYEQLPGINRSIDPARMYTIGSSKFGYYPLKEYKDKYGHPGLEDMRLYNYEVTIKDDETRNCILTTSLGMIGLCGQGIVGNAMPDLVTNTSNGTATEKIKNLRIANHKRCPDGFTMCQWINITNVTSGGLPPTYAMPIFSVDRTMDPYADYNMPPIQIWPRYGSSNRLSVFIPDKRLAKSNGTVKPAWHNEDYLEYYDSPSGVFRYITIDGVKHDTITEEKYKDLCYYKSYWFGGNPIETYSNFGSFYSSDITIPTNSWHHITVIMDSNYKLKLFYDGNSVLTVDVRNMLNTKDKLAICYLPVSPITECTGPRLNGFDITKIASRFSYKIEDSTVLAWPLTTKDSYKLPTTYMGPYLRKHSKDSL